MNDFLILERFLWFDRQIRGNRFPNAISLADSFGLSVRTAHRNISYMRDRLGAPLEYDIIRKGYCYPADSFQLPHLEASQEEILAILLARTLLSHTAGGLISETIGAFEKRLFRATGHFGLTRARLEEAFSASWHGYSPSPAATFRQVTDALLRQRLLTFSYLSPQSDASTERTVAPHHLQHYMGSWVLIAWCHSRNDWRKFYLSRMSRVAAGRETFTVRPRHDWARQLEGGFGIFQGEEPITIVLRFEPTRARWVSKQVWHPDQILEYLDDGSMLLSLPVTDYREVQMMILQFGADVEVLQPPSLRHQIRTEIDRMAACYQTP